MNEILYQGLSNIKNHTSYAEGQYDTIEGAEYVDKIIDIDQQPIGRTPRSNPATYTGVFNDIRELFSQTSEAKMRGYKPGRFSFNIKGGREEAFKFIDNLKVFSLLANVADVKSLVIHPASTTHSQLNDEELAEQQIYQNTIRLSIGTEHIDDIIADLEAGFAAVRGE